jgi:hypothetical protein
VQHEDPSHHRHDETARECQNQTLVHDSHLSFTKT